MEFISLHTFPSFLSFNVAACYNYVVSSIPSLIVTGWFIIHAIVDSTNPNFAGILRAWPLSPNVLHKQPKNQIPARPGHTVRLLPNTIKNDDIPSCIHLLRLFDLDGSGENACLGASLLEAERISEQTYCEKTWRGRPPNDLPTLTDISHSSILKPTSENIHRHLVSTVLLGGMGWGGEPASMIKLRGMATVSAGHTTRDVSWSVDISTSGGKSAWELSMVKLEIVNRSNESTLLTVLSLFSKWEAVQR